MKFFYVFFPPQKYFVKLRNILSDSECITLFKQLEDEFKGKTRGDVLKQP